MDIAAKILTVIGFFFYFLMMFAVIMFATGMVALEDTSILRIIMVLSLSTASFCGAITLKVLKKQ